MSEKEKEEGIDPLAIIDLMDREMGRYDFDDDRLGFYKSFGNDRYSFWIRTAGTELNEGVPAMRALIRFPDVEDPAIIMKAFNVDRGSW